MKIIIRLLKNPLAAFVGMGLGVYFGVTQPQLSLRFVSFGEVYKILLVLTVIPILICAIVTSIANLVRRTVIQPLLGKIAVKFILYMLICSIIGISMGLIFKPGYLSSESRKLVSEQVSIRGNVLEVSLNDEDDSNFGQNYVVEKIKKVIPTNIFYILTTDNMFAILIFSIIFGLATGMRALLSKTKASKPHDIHADLIINFFDNIFNIFTLLISYLLVILPVALIFIIAGEIAQSGWGLFLSSYKLILSFYILGAIILVINTIILSISSKTSIFNTIKRSAYFSLVAFTTRNSFASMPIAMNSLINNFGMSRRFTRLVFPLYLVLGRFGNIAYFALVAVFAAQLYFIQLTPTALLFICLGVILAGIGSAGASGFATLTILSIVLEPLGIPYETSIVILYAIDPIIDPLRSLLIVNTNASFSAFTHVDFKKMVDKILKQRATNSFDVTQKQKNYGNSQ